MKEFPTISFWVCAVCLLHAYLGYPLLMALLSRASRRLSQTDQLHLPRVSLIISAYNEGRVIESKLANSLALDYPKDFLEILVISDCSDDGTDEIVQRFAPQGVKLVRQAPRRGKTEGLNLAVPQCQGEVLVFSDSNAMYQPDAIRHLVRHFVDPKVGYVVGNARYLEHATGPPSARSEGLYWKFETWLKNKESLFDSVVGGDGAVYAIRRGLYTPLRPTDINDFLNPLQIIDRGYVGVFEPAAVCFEEAAKSFAQEFKRKTRIISRSLSAIFQVPGVLTPFKFPRHWFMLVSHKLLRWFAPFFMLVMLASSLAMWDVVFYQLVILLQMAFYLSAFIGWQLSESPKTWKAYYLPYYLCLVNMASLIGILKYLKGDLSPTWVTVREETTNEVKSQ